MCRTAGVHRRAGLRPRRGPEVSCAGREGGARQRGEGGPLPRHTLGHGETGGPESLLGFQGTPASTAVFTPSYFSVLAQCVVINQFLK